MFNEIAKLKIQLEHLETINKISNEVIDRLKLKNHFTKNDINVFFERILQEERKQRKDFRLYNEEFNQNTDCEPIAYDMLIFMELNALKSNNPISLMMQFNDKLNIDKYILSTKLDFMLESLKSKGTKLDSI